MIESLTISNYALIDRLDIDFKPGLNIITGETGAGKSIMLGALSMLLGNRADSRVVTDKDKKSVVEAVFDITGYESIRPLLADADIECTDNKLILRREINPAGRSRSFVNDTPAQLTLLRDLAIRLVDIHSQHQNLLLSTPEYQLRIIDTLLPDPTVKSTYREAYDEYRSALRKYQLAKRAVETGKAEEEYFRYQLEMLERLNPQTGEQQLLEAEREVLANMTTLKQALAQLLSIMSEGEENIGSMLRTAESLTGSLNGLSEADGLTDRIESLRIEALDIAATLESINSRLDADPRRLETIDQRLTDIYELEHKLNIANEDDLAALREDLKLKIDTIDNGSDRVKALAAKAKIAKRNALDKAASLTEARKDVAREFGSRLQSNALPLGMKNLVVDLRFYSTELTAEGTDGISFMFAFNKNQSPMPVRDTASGGEISRLMLVIKAIIADRIQLPSIIFDEVDTGVSGDIANRMGEMMQSISNRIQVITITHLPQVAAKGNAHFKVYKQDSETATNTRVKSLSYDERIDELSLMLSGDSANESARLTALSLLDAAVESGKERD